LGIAFIVYLYLWIGNVLDILFLVAALLVPGIVLFGLRFVVNWKRCRRASRITVREIIDDLVDQRSDHSVRADGLPYNRVEIEQIVAKILCEALAVKPEEIKPEARIYKDLGAQ
jgi:uncharacterized protein (DUF433 family)